MTVSLSPSISSTDAVNFSRRDPSWVRSCHVSFETAVEEFTMVHSPSSRNNRLLEDMSIWKPPQAGWIKANIDAGFNDGQAALAFVTKDNMGRLLFAATKLMPTRILTWQSYWV
ncbi:hypothetical protein FNV43_RR04407 [Rhamnella rubrinervis]|uniref:RNase H type-1 domain-containing protein n=1 Tax=Rhamnella rubrinervis TaxID=2594499 RepID=A0A8K0MQK2_9ROSA|nr:hypothetical protein FNV43_RR04407 [Rhamnella rubrinervis]